MTAVDHEPPPPEPPDLADDPPPRRGGRGGHDNGHRPLPEAPHAEAALLGTCLVLPDATQQAIHTGLTRTAFRIPTHRHIWDALTTIADQGGDPDAATVHHHLTQTGHPPPPGLITDLTTKATWATNIGPLADEILDAAHRRHTITALSAAIDAAHQGEPLDLDQLLDHTRPPTPTSWAPQDLTGLLTGGITRPEPGLLTTDDEHHQLLYPGKIHAFNAESESGKSWLALHACAQEMTAGAHVLYIDFEDDAAGVTSRLVGLGVEPELIVAAFHYVRPDDAYDAAAHAEVQRILDDHQPTLAVLDGVTEALVMNGWKINENDDAAAFAVRILRPIADAGPAVVLIDHVTKDKDQQGSHAIGAQHKKAFITGAAYKLEVRKPFGEGRRGEARITVTKDRPGAIRGWALDGKVVGTFHLASQHDQVAAGITRADEHHPGETFRPTHLMEAVSLEIERSNEAGLAPSKSAVDKCVPGQRRAKFLAIDQLITEGYVTVEPSGQSLCLHTKRPYRERDDPHSERYEPGPTEPPEEEF